MIERALAGARVTVVGLGAHGGGLATVRYLVDAGATVVVTDLRDESAIGASIAALPEGVRGVFGRHERDDIVGADLVVKNPAVPRSAPILADAPAVTTDIALFLAAWRTAVGAVARVGAGPGVGGAGGAAPGAGGAPAAPLVAITGTKGKSTTSAATAHLLSAAFSGTRLGGNITVSPLTFLSELRPGDPVVLELSSFQLGDLAWCRATNGSRRGADGLPAAIVTPWHRATVAVITNIFRDHMDYYHGSIDDYVADKCDVYRGAPGGTLVLGAEDAWTDRFATDAEARGCRVVRAGAAPVRDDLEALLPHALAVPGAHSRTAVRVAAAVAREMGRPAAEIAAAAGSFRGIAHRLEVVARRGAIVAINDTAATIPEAALAGVDAVDGAPVVIAGGSDKGLDLAPLVAATQDAMRRGGVMILLAGTASDRLAAALHDHQLPFDGPYASLEAAADAAVERARRIASRGGGARTAHGHEIAASILLSPGCASFGMFRNEFDRGDRFRAAMRARLG